MSVELLSQQDKFEQKTNTNVLTFTVTEPYFFDFLRDGSISKRCEIAPGVVLDWNDPAGDSYVVISDIYTNPDAYEFYQIFRSRMELVE